VHSTSVWHGIAALFSPQIADLSHPHDHHGFAKQHRAVFWQDWRRYETAKVPWNLRGISRITHIGLERKCVKTGRGKLHKPA